MSLAPICPEPVDAAEADEPRDRKEAQIVQAAGEAFLEHGYAATSMDAVASRARVSKTTLYTRFPSKDALFAAVIGTECARFGMRFTPTDFADVPVEEALGRIGRRFVDLVTSPQATAVHRIVMAEAPRFPEVARAFYEAGPVHGRRALGAYLADATARGELAVDDPDFAASQLFMALKGICGELEFGLAPAPTPAERDRHVRRVVRLFLEGALPRRDRAR